MGKPSRSAAARYLPAFGLALALFLGGTCARAADPQPGPADEPALPEVIFDRDAPPETRIPLTPTLNFGARVELDYELERGFELDAGRDDREEVVDPQLQLALSYDPSRNFRAFVYVNLHQEFALDEPTQTKRKLQLDVTQAYLLWRNLLGERLDLQIGRQRFRDAREWVYDEELDAVRGFLRFGGASLELSANRRNLADSDLLRNDRQERINNYVAYARYPLGPEADLGAYWVLRDQLEDRGESPIFIGVHADGDVGKDFEYWLELAHVGGRNGSRKINGYGFDVGGTYKPSLPLRPSLTLGYAFGSGDSNPNDGTDKNFRQTGLQDNEGRFNGVTRFKYYGEVVDPELSNLRIFTAGIGFRPFRRTSIDLVYHYYTQHKAVEDEIRDSNIDEDADGVNRKLGDEFDLVFGYREREGHRLAIEVILAYFRPGAAFAPSAPDAFFGGFEIKYSF